MLEYGASFDSKNSCRYIVGSFPYIRLLFIRLVLELFIKRTLKQRKVDLFKQGYDPERVGRDPLCFRNDHAQNHGYITRETFTKIDVGSLAV